MVRGVQEASIPLRPQVKLVAGRMFRMGSSEIIVGNSIAKGFTGVGLQGTLNWGMRKWTVVGIFDAGNTGFSSEIWGDVDQVMQAFRRPVYSSLIFKLRDPAAFPAAKTAIETDPRLTLEAKRETRYYLDQSEMMAKFLRILGLSLTDHLFDRRDHRRHDHHVFGGGQPDRGDRNDAGAGLPPAEHPGRLSRGVAASGRSSAARRDSSSPPSCSSSPSPP